VGPRGPSEKLRQPVDLGRVHGLYGIVDDHEAERAVPGGGARKEQRQTEHVQLALADHAKRRAGWRHHCRPPPRQAAEDLDR
jgi:hypothetical protein